MIPVDGKTEGGHAPAAGQQLGDRAGPTEDTVRTQQHSCVPILVCRRPSRLGKLLCHVSLDPGALSCLHQPRGWLSALQL